MIAYEEVLQRLFALADQKYHDFHKRLLKNGQIRLIGVRVPALKSLAREWKGEVDGFLSFPDDYYEVTFLKCTLVGGLPYEEFIKRVDKVVPLLDNWATCDLFKARCIRYHREEFLPYIKKYLKSDREFTVRYGLVCLLKDYVEECYLPFLFESVSIDADSYYVMMGAAWLMAEVLVRFFKEGVDFLKRGTLPVKTHNRAIQKACESYRLTAEEKAILKLLRRE